MAAPRIPQKWRPTLAMVIFAVLLTVLALPAAICVVSARWTTPPVRWDRSRSASGVARLHHCRIAVVFSRTITGPSMR